MARGPRAEHGCGVAPLYDDLTGTVQGLLASVREPAEGLTATALGQVLLFVGANTVFAELQDALDRIWRVPGRLRKASA